MEGLKLKENEVVHCKTEKQANKVLKIAYKLGCEWRVKNLGNRFYDCKENTVYHLDNIITYSDLEYCKGKELKVITAKEFLKRHKETKKGKLTIIVSKNYKDLYEDNLALLNHILLDTVKNDEEWVERVQKSNLNITLYTDKNDTELFKKSFDKFKVKLMDVEELTLENIQVDCSDLTTEQIEEMKRVVVDNGELLYEDETWEIYDNRCFFLTDNECDLDGFYIALKDKEKTTITYDKFMELFNAKKEKPIEELHVEHKEQNSIGKSYSKEDLFLSVESKPKQYQIGIDTFERAKANLTKEEYLACLKFGIDKYTWRLKGQDIEDFEKIIAYANEAINVLKSKK